MMIALPVGPYATLMPGAIETNVEPEAGGSTAVRHFQYSADAPEAHRRRDLRIRERSFRSRAFRNGSGRVVDRIFRGSRRRPPGRRGASLWAREDREPLRHGGGGSYLYCGGMGHLR